MKLEVVVLLIALSVVAIQAKEINTGSEKVDKEPPAVKDAKVVKDENKQGSNKVKLAGTRNRHYCYSNICDKSGPDCPRMEPCHTSCFTISLIDSNKNETVVQTGCWGKYDKPKEECKNSEEHVTDKVIKKTECCREGGCNGIETGNQGWASWSSNWGNWGTTWGSWGGNNNNWNTWSSNWGTWASWSGGEGSIECYSCSSLLSSNCPEEGFTSSDKVNCPGKCYKHIGQLGDLITVTRGCTYIGSCSEENFDEEFFGVRTRSHNLCCDDQTLCNSGEGLQALSGLILAAFSTIIRML